jgi:hypothetical protein
MPSIMNHLLKGPESSIIYEIEPMVKNNVLFRSRLNRNNEFYLSTLPKNKGNYFPNQRNFMTEHLALSGYLVFMRSLIGPRIF